MKNDHKNDISEFAQRYVEQLENLLDSLDLEALAHIVSLLEETRARRQTVYIIGNGGSAATANHMALDFSFCTRMCSGPRMRAVSLASNIPYITAAANDLDYDEIFLQQLKDLLVQGDVVIAISASGNSENVVKAIKYANETGAHTVGFVGFDGGQLKEICDFCMHMESVKGEYGPVEDMHMILDHLITAYFIERG